MSNNLTKKPEFRFGPYVPLTREGQRVIIEPKGVVDYYKEPNPLARKLLGEILPDDAIVDAPSMVLPLLLKKKTIWPARVDNDECIDKDQAAAESNDESGDDDIRVIKIVEPKTEKIAKESHRYRDVEDYVRTTVVRKLSRDDQTTLAIPDYDKSLANDLLATIGLGLVTEFVLEDKYRRLSSRAKRGSSHLWREVDSLKTDLDEARSMNKPFRLDRPFKCPRCPFKCELRSILDKHLENPHTMGYHRKYTCNWCGFISKDIHQISYHTYMVHKKRCLPEKPLLLHRCTFCDFESSSKHNYNRHIFSCEKNFNENSTQTLEIGNYSAITPKFITQIDIKTYESILKNLRLAAYNPHQIEVRSHESRNNVLLLTKSAVDSFSRPPPPTITQLSSPFTSNPAGLTASTSSSESPSPMNQIAQSMMATGASSNNIPENRASSGILVHPKTSSAFSNGTFIVKNTENVVMGPSIGFGDHQSMNQGSSLVKARKLQKTAQSNNNNGPILVDLEDRNDDHEKSKESYVICEICDAYIDSFSLFKTHMLEIHRVKIQSKFLSASRPPLNCQRCQWRFFTDQGLDRHLLGSHGLVTISMQNKAEGKCDSGRCTICGRKYPNGLVAHTKDAHKVHLKPAQLSYKCKVCSATYGLYSHFEKHVYQLHPGL